jgi:hypothetical protein
MIIGIVSPLARARARALRHTLKGCLRDQALRNGRLLGRAQNCHQLADLRRRQSDALLGGHPALAFIGVGLDESPNVEIGPTLELLQGYP